MTSLRDIRLKMFVKDKTKEMLLQIGRNLVAERGVEALSARKLATASNSSVGMVYNIFGTMDNYNVFRKDEIKEFDNKEGLMQNAQ